MVHLLKTNQSYAGRIFFYARHKTLPMEIKYLDKQLKVLEVQKWIFLNRQVGLTDLYNLFHDPEVTDEDIQELRDLHVEIDETVKIAHGWNDLDLGHDFHEVPYLPENDRTRFTVSEPARLEILKRLLDLNEKRHREEIEAGSSDKKGSGRKKKNEGGLF